MDIKIKRPIAPSYIAYLSAGITFICIVSMSVSAYLFYKQRFVYGGIGFGLVVIGACLLEIWNLKYAWVASSRLEYKNRKLMYIYYEVFNMLGNNKNTYEIYSIDSCRMIKGGRYLKIKGDISFKASYRKRKKVKECVIYEVNDSAIEYIEKRMNVKVKR